jgi:xylulokinase
VDTRAAREIEDLTASLGAERILSHGGNALTSQAIGPKILWLKRNRPDIYAKARMFLNSTSFLVHRLTGRFVTDHNSASRVAPLYDIEPDSRNARVYEKRYATFRKLYPRVRDLTEELGADSETEMSRADRSPGAPKQQVPAAAGQPDSNSPATGEFGAALACAGMTRALASPRQCTLDNTQVRVLV